jgi:hypothetical protein
VKTMIVAAIWIAYLLILHKYWGMPDILMFGGVFMGIMFIIYRAINDNS